MIFTTTNYSIKFEWINYPNLVLKNYVNENDKHKIFLPIFEGVEISDLNFRKKYYTYSDTDYPSKGWEGVYPGPVSMQFMAYYNEQSGLYIAAHDHEFNTKVVDANDENGGIVFYNKFFPWSDAIDYKYNFPYVTGFFEVNWYDAAAIYKDFVKDKLTKNQTKIKDNQEASSWLRESPIIVIYPIRGEKVWNNIRIEPDSVLIVEDNGEN